MNLISSSVSFRSLAIAAGLGMALTAAPAVAAAEELPADGGQQLAEAVEPGGATGSGDVAVAGGEQGGGQLPGDGQAGSGAEDGSQPGDGSGSGSEEEGGGTEDGTGADDSGSADEAGDGTEGDAADGEGAGKDEDPAAGIEDGAPADGAPAAGDAAGLPAPEADHAPGWGVDGRYYNSDGSVATGWLVTSERIDGTEGDIQRYWLGDDGSFLADRAERSFEAVLETGASGLFRLTSDGWVLRGWSGDGLFCADNDGRLWTGWAVTGELTGGRLERYWFDEETGEMARGRLVGESEGDASGYYAWALDDGRILRGKWDDGAGHVYVADNDGRLATAGTADGTGWLVTDRYDGGFQRYRIEWGGKGVGYYAHSGYFSAPSERGGAARNYFGLGGEGYVLRGVGKGVYGDWLMGDNDGALATGWVVTGEFGTGGRLERYWFDSSSAMAKGRLVGASEGDASGYYAWALDDGRILRGKWDDGAGHVYVADNDGRLATAGTADGTGWLVTDRYDGGFQRYRIEWGGKGVGYYAHTGFFWATPETGGASQRYFGVGGQGYILRGTTAWGLSVLLANNDGVMPGNEGWIVSDAYGQGLQRYFAAPISGQTNFFGALTGFFHIVDGHAVSGRASDGAGYYYGRSEGYVLRGSMNVNGEYLIADNDGVIAAYLNGIDISNWQKEMDVSKIASNFIIVKVSEGADYLNPSFRRFADAVLAAGKQLGLYHFYHTEASPEEQADFFVSQVRPYLGQAVLVLDWEDTTGSNAIAQGPSVAKRFLDRVYEQTGVRSLIYMSASVTRSYDWSSVANSGYGLWVAQYLNKYYDTVNGINGYVQNPTLDDKDFGAWGRDVTMYQYTSTGKLDGWSGFLDFNVFYGTKDDWQALATPVVRAATAAVRAVASASIVAGDGSRDAIEV
ncbi:GH25 family lysozyme [Enorma phocaeensis]|uniref:GH25 family lysozyme n=1 Tax=Enorma phocaeensis TaxID=1871019 RepID=UPI003209265F